MIHITKGKTSNFYYDLQISGIISDMASVLVHLHISWNLNKKTNENYKIFKLCEKLLLTTRQLVQLHVVGYLVD